MVEPTKRQQDVLEFVRAFIERQGYALVYAEIAEGLGNRSVSTVAEHVEVLVGKGYLRKRFNAARSLMVLDSAELCVPSEENGNAFPPGARYIPVSALPRLFAPWPRRRPVPDLGTFTLPEDSEVQHGRA